MENPVLPSSCVTPAGTSIEVQNEWEENTHRHTHKILFVLTNMLYFAPVLTFTRNPRRHSRAELAMLRPLPLQPRSPTVVWTKLARFTVPADLSASISTRPVCVVLGVLGTNAIALAVHRAKPKGCSGFSHPKSPEAVVLTQRLSWGH